MSVRKMEIPKQWFIDHGFLSEEMTFQCLQCGKIFKDNIPLVDHGTRYMHFLIRPMVYHCPYHKHGYAIVLYNDEQEITIEERNYIKELLEAKYICVGSKYCPNCGAKMDGETI